MKRRQVITLIGGAAAWPLAARAQQREKMRRIGVLMNLAADDPQSPVRIAAFLQGLQESGWTDGRNLRIDYRWGAADLDRYRRYAAELVALVPDVILAGSTINLTVIQQTTSTVPVGRSPFFHPRRIRAFAEPVSRAQFTTLPFVSFTLM